MTARLIAVTEDRGYYAIVPGARAQRIETALRIEPVDKIEIVESLLGWDGWEFAAILYRGAYYQDPVFVGRTDPERDEWPTPIAEALAEAGY